MLRAQAMAKRVSIDDICDSVIQAGEDSPAKAKCKINRWQGSRLIGRAGIQAANASETELFPRTKRTFDQWRVPIPHSALVK